MRILTFSTLFPSSARPRHGIFVETRLRRLVAGGAIEARVVAPVPWFPFAGARFGRYAAFAQTPREETRHGVRVRYPRYPAIPKFGMTLAPWLLAAAALPALRALQREGFDFDLIDAHYFYPDGVAAAWLARRLGKPLVVSARGTDINLIPRYAIPRRLIQWAARRACAIVTVCESLRDRLIELGVAGERVRVLRNGVDAALFKPPVDRGASRAALGVKGRMILSVGNLIALKGHDIAIRALADMDSDVLFIVGEGEEEGRLKSLAAQLGVARRVHFRPAMAQAQLAELYGAADALVLMSGQEGWANVLLEAMACGTPVVATAVGGTPEIVRAPAAGRLVRERSPQALRAVLDALFAAPPARAATRAYAEQHGWDEVVTAQLELYRRCATQEL